MRTESASLEAGLHNRRELLAALTDVDAAVDWLEPRIAPERAPQLIHVVLDALLEPRDDVADAARGVPLDG